MPFKSWLGLFLARQEYIPENRDNIVTRHFRAGAARIPERRSRESFACVGRTLGFSDGRAYKLLKPPRIDVSGSERDRVMHEVGEKKTHWHEPTGNDGPASASSAGRKRPMTCSWSRKASRSSAASASRRPGPADEALEAPRRQGSYIQLHGTEGKWGCYVVEVPGAGALNPEKHIYEEIYLVVEGRGTTEVWLEGDNKRHVFEWQKGSLFSIPVNAMHRIVNASSAPALLLAGTTAPNLMNLINNIDAMFKRPYQFRDRFSGADDFYKYKDDIEPDPVRGLAMRRTNFIPDIINCDLPLDNRRSPGWRRVEPFMTGNTFYLWIGQHENGRYSKAHAHTSAAVLICLKGKGYTYTWPERNGVTPWKDGKADEVKRVDYEPVGMVSAAPGGARWFHQHFGASKEPLAADRLVRPAQSRPRARPAGREAHRLYRDGYPRGRNRHPLLDGRPVSAQGIRREAEGGRRARTA